MTEFAKEVIIVNLEDEMRQSYLDYAMSVIVGRALPDVRDGLKPVHRRVLYAMLEQSNDWNKAYKKSARIVGDVIGKYHPHGETAVYDTIVRLAQPFSMRYMLVDGQGNFGSVDGDAPAAMRYTEIRMGRIAHELIADIDRETVDFVANYDASEHEPTVLPARIPNLLVNGSSGIAVGMATNIPPHNLTEVINTCIALIENSGLGVDELMQIMPGPDFPTAAIINGVSGIREAYQTGRGRIYVRARSHTEEIGAQARQAIVVTELPFQVNKARLLEKIADLVKLKKIEGISELRDESDKDGMRVVITLKRGEVADVVLNNLYQHTQLQSVFGINMVALNQGRPQLMNLKEMLEAFLAHRREVVTRRTIFDLKKARERAHILEGQAIALTNIDEVIALIKASAGPAEARVKLMAQRWKPGIVIDMLKVAEVSSSRPDNLGPEYGLHGDEYRLSEAQAQAILDLRLQRLTGLEQDKIFNEYKELLDKINKLLDVLTDPDLMIAVVREELEAVRNQFGDDRRSEIIEQHIGLSMKDLITEEDVVVTLSHAGYAKSQPADDYTAQRRGGRGKFATRVKEEDFIDKLFVANTHDTLLCFSSRGKVYWLKVYDLPQAGRAARGKPIINLLPLHDGERINAVLPVREFPSDRYIFMATTTGLVKKTPLSDFSRPRSNGIIALELVDDDTLVDVALTDGRQDIMLFATSGKAIRFNEQQVRPMGRPARGVRGIGLTKGYSVNALIVVRDGDILTVAEKGFGKRTPVDEYPIQGRAGRGVISLQTSERNGNAICALQVDEEDEIMLISSNGTLVRTRVSEVSVMGRNTQGVTLIRLDDDEKLVGVEKIAMMENQDKS
ncbi:MAG: DNA gyrase subunit A [Gammaproteobacteria bacterium]|nr:MAG: DNA gyrase subunit A [Gammaproteobacteria bacterium]